VSAQYRSDPFVEYHIYDRELLGGLEEEIAIEEEDANVIDLSDE
jgi:hypothetical protein